MAKMLGYMRVSTDDQTCSLQEDALWEAGCDEIYQDIISGNTTSRKGLDECLAELEENDTLVVWKSDRLGRKASHLFKLVSELAERRISFISITERFDTADTIGWAMFQMLGVFAELERNTLIERIHAGIDAAKERGVKFGRPPLDPTISTKIQRLLTTTDLSYREIARRCGCDKSSVGRVNKKMLAKRSAKEMRHAEQAAGA